MPKPRNLHWNPISQRWESAGRDGVVKAFINETGLGAPNIFGFIGSNAAITAVGTLAIAVGTISIAGTVNASGVAMGDKIFGVPKADRSGGHVGVVGFYVPTTNTLNVWLQNSKADSAGSFPATGWDVIAFRSA